MRGQKGITLVALIITIIVLLILAVVSIGAISDSKIIDHADTAKDKYVESQEDESTKIKDAETYMNDIIKDIK